MGRGTGMTLRFDLPLMSDDELTNWITDLMKFTHYTDLRTLRDTLTKVIDEYDREQLHNTYWKMCDRCELTYPEQESFCKCGNDNLRLFRIHDNTNELKSNW
jgi:hypothetical protein